MFAARLSKAVFGGMLLFAASGCSGGGGSEDAGGGATPPAPSRPDGSVVFFGDSLTQGHVIPQSEAYPALVAEDMAAQGITNPVVNAGVSGDTSADGAARVSSVLDGQVALFFLALGTNDGRHGVAPSEMRTNLKAIIDTVRASSPEAQIVIAGAVPLAEYGQQYDAEFRQVFPDLAAETGATLMPFLLEGVFGDDRYYTVDNIHPNALGHKVIAGNVWKIIEPLLRANILFSSRLDY